jgi:hypothetical protein
LVVLLGVGVAVALAVVLLGHAGDVAALAPRPDPQAVDLPVATTAGGWMRR